MPGRASGSSTRDEPAERPVAHPVGGAQHRLGHGADALDDVAHEDHERVQRHRDDDRLVVDVPERRRQQHEQRERRDGVDDVGDRQQHGICAPAAHREVRRREGEQEADADGEHRVAGVLQGVVPDDVPVAGQLAPVPQRRRGDDASDGHGCTMAAGASTAPRRGAPVSRWPRSGTRCGSRRARRPRTRRCARRGSRRRTRTPGGPAARPAWRAGPGARPARARRCGRRARSPRRRRG